jgi:hypothetical protein
MIEKVTVIKDGFGLKQGNELVLNDSKDLFYYKSTDRDVSDNSTTETVFSITLKYDFVVSKLGEYFDVDDSDIELTNADYEELMNIVLNKYSEKVKLMNDLINKNKELQERIIQLEVKSRIDETLMAIYR